MIEQNAKIRQYLFFRLALLYSVLVSCVFLHWNGVFTPVVSIAVLSLCGFSFLMTSAFLLLFEKTKDVTYFVNSQVAYDLLFTTALTYYTGTNDSIYVTFYLVNIMFTAVLINGLGALVAALVCGALYFVIAFVSSDNFNGERSYFMMTTETSFIVVALLTGQLVDELKRNRARIGRLERLSDDIVESLDAGLIGISDSGAIIKVNRTARQILGMGAEVQDARLEDLMPGFLSVEGTEVREIDIRGSMRRFLVSRVGLTEKSHMILFRDLTEILELEERVKNNAHLASVGSLAASLAHEIRNPIAAISGAAQMLESGSVDSAEQKRLNALIVRETERVDLLVSQLLRFARAEPVEKEACNLYQIMKDSIESLCARPDFAATGIKVDLEVDPSQAELCKSNSNREQMAEVFSNLLLNSFQALSDQKQGKAKRIVVTMLRRPHHVEVVVADNGPGIPREFRHRVFDPFFTTKSYGTGLGLARVYKILKDHEGQVDVESPEGKEGTTLRVKIPVGA